jgi:hypothetical protein
MASPRLSASLLGVAAVLQCSCGQSSNSGSASSQAAASSAPPAASSTPSDAAVSSAAASALPPAAAAAPTVAPAAAAEPQKREEPTAAELLHDDPGYEARERKLEALYQNAKERDPTGQVERAQAAALAERRACADRACLDAWFRRREAALKQYVED